MLDALGNDIPNIVKQEVIAQINPAIEAIVSTNEYKQSIKWETWALREVFWNPYNFTELCFKDNFWKNSCRNLQWPQWNRWISWRNWTNWTNWTNWVNWVNWTTWTTWTWIVWPAWPAGPVWPAWPAWTNSALIVDNTLSSYIDIWATRIQWGKVTVMTTWQVVFPVPFSSLNYSISSQLVNHLSSDVDVFITSTSPSFFNFDIRNSAWTLTPWSFHFIAIWAK